MKFDIARQPLVPAFLTLAALAVVAMWSAGGPAVSMAVQAGHAAGTVDIGRNAAGALAVSSPGELLAQFQAAHPVWARWIAGLLMLFTGMSVGRLTVRYNLYSVGTCLAIPLYGAIACGLAVGGDCLTTFAASALLALATKNFCRSYCNGFGFDAIFRASLYIGLLPLVATAAAPLLILPLAVMLFRRTPREVAVAVAGLLLPALTLCYVNWAAGGEFLAQVAEPGSAFIAGTPLSLFLSTPVQNLVLPGAVFLLDLTALLFFLSDIYALGTKPRLIFIFNISALLLTAAALCGPAATPATVALAAVPSAVLCPSCSCASTGRSPFPSTCYCSPLPSLAQFYNNLFSSKHSTNGSICHFVPKCAIAYGRLKSFNCIFENEQQ